MNFLIKFSSQPSTKVTWGFKWEGDVTGIWLESPSGLAIRGGVRALGGSIFNSEQHLQWNNNWEPKIFIAKELSWLLCSPEHLPVLLTGSTGVQMPLFHKIFREQSSWWSHWLCSVSSIGPRLILLHSSSTNLIRQFYFNGRDRCSPLHQFQKLINSWMPVELQLFNMCME